MKVASLQCDEHLIMATWKCVLPSHDHWRLSRAIVWLCNAIPGTQVSQSTLPLLFPHLLEAKQWLRVPWASKAGVRMRILS